LGDRKRGTAIVLLLAVSSLALVAGASARVSDAPAKIPIGARGGVLVSAYGSIWTTDLTLDRLVRIDPKAARVTARRAVGLGPYGLAAGAGSLWVASRNGNTIARVNPGSLKVVKRIGIGYSSFAAAFGAGSVWVSVESTSQILRVDPNRNRVVKRIKGALQPNGLVYAYGAVWASDLGRGQVLRINPRTNRVTARIKVPAADWVTPGGGALWVSSERNRVYRIDPATRKVVASVAVGSNPLASAWVDGELWVPNIDSGTISVVDTQSTTVARTIQGGSSPLWAAATADGVFVSMSDDGAVWRFSR
jgi:virginiamycin B lyase